MFLDEAEIEVQGGRGGDGCLSFRHDAAGPKGGPDGGNGGRGGNVIFVADRGVTSLGDIARAGILKAECGKPGTGSNCNGKSAPDLVCHVPVGTVFYDRESGELLMDLAMEGQEWMAVRGGKGGRGNKSYATATNQTPREFEFGSLGKTRALRVELKLIADVGLVGLPNAGKSTLLSRCSAARPKIADYPFTTLTPQLGIVERGFVRFVLADIPGLIEGASAGKGLGHQFLRHIERTRLIVHLLDLADAEVEELVNRYRTIRAELMSFSPELAAKPEIVVGNKIDVPEARERLVELRSLLDCEVHGISGVTGEGIDELLKALFVRLGEMGPAP